ncbi:MAG: low molecular weight phosphatase family protein, partial [Atopobiaceae bacterium]
PAEEVDPGALAELARRGVSAIGLRPKALAELPRIDWLVTMGCGVACPSVPCKHREDWGLADPMGGAPSEYAECADAIARHLEVLREQIG